MTAHDTKSAHEYIFTFAPGVTIDEFSVHMLDFGDLNPSLNTQHTVTMTAFDANGPLPDAQQPAPLSYTTGAVKYPGPSNIYGNLKVNGDALQAPPGMPGNWTWLVTGQGIVMVKLEFPAGYDPNIALDLLSIVPHCP